MFPSYRLRYIQTKLTALCIQIVGTLRIRGMGTEALKSNHFQALPCLDLAPCLAQLLPINVNAKTQVMCTYSRLTTTIMFHMLYIQIATMTVSSSLIGKGGLMLMICKMSLTTATMYFPSLQSTPLSNPCNSYWYACTKWWLCSL